ncbi:60S ribosomal protein L31 [Candidatus Woesearchaeota archaeon]|nr:60S ribosomal protein L31 [Candidatus Woesearchaeota archaeon]
MTDERTYVIPLRKEWLKTPKYRRAKKAVAAVKVFLQKHMKGEEVRLGKFLNEDLWKHGIQNPPPRIKVNVLKDKEGVIRAELFGKPIQQGKEETKKEEKKEQKKEKTPANEVEAEIVETKEEVPKADAPKKKAAKKAAPEQQ